MLKNKIKSFTLSEMLVVMIITAIVVGMAFSVLKLVQKQIHTIQKNFDKTSTLALFEQRLWLDFNEYNSIKLFQKQNNIRLESELDTIIYAFSDDFILRNTDTIKLKLSITKGMFQSQQVKEGVIDAIQISGESELPNYTIFVSKKNDLTYFMNQDGF
ncbi:MAG: prepilin-type N-terminal cleavage/methylation domain-containing protein [Arcicella sp.]|nr:prepilin-type N-terminal cleavage/methylation domain-containing protein [Arcicella sp.]